MILKPEDVMFADQSRKGGEGVVQIYVRVIWVSKRDTSNNRSSYSIMFILLRKSERNYSRDIKIIVYCDLQSQNLFNYSHCDI